MCGGVKHPSYPNNPIFSVLPIRIKIGCIIPALYSVH
jgi:hypothetical protein